MNNYFFYRTERKGHTSNKDSPWNPSPAWRKWSQRLGPLPAGALGLWPAAGHPSSYSTGEGVQCQWGVRLLSPLTVLLKSFPDQWLPKVGTVGLSAFSPL